MAMRLLVCTLIACLVSNAACFAPPSVALRTSQPAAASSVVMMATARTKPMRVNTRNREYNKKYRSEMRTRIKRVRARPEKISGGAAAAAAAAG